MAEMTPEQRIAALKAKRALAAEANDPVVPAPPARPSATGGAAGPAPARAARSSAATAIGPTMSRARVLTASTSAVGFAAMVVAMGPLRAPSTEVSADAPASTTDPSLAGGSIPPAPPMALDGSPSRLAMVDKGLGATTESSVPADDGSTTQVAGASTTPTTAAPTAAPAAAAPATAAPATAAPATAAPATAAPATAAPTTAAPTTAAPTTAAPTTAAPTTAAPTTKGSG